MSEWLDAALAADSGLLVRATADRCADLLLREDHVALSMGDERAEYSWDDEWHIDAMEGLLWQFTSVATYNGDIRRLDVAFYAPEGSAPDLAASTRRKRFSRALDGLSTREDLIALHRYGSKSDRADLPPLQTLTTLLRKHPSLRAGLSDSQTVNELIARIPALRDQTWATAASDEPIPRDVGVVLSSMRSVGLVHPELRPLTPTEPAPRAEAIEKVLVDLRSHHPHRAEEITTETVARIVDERYFDVEPWAVEPLIDYVDRHDL